VEDTGTWAVRTDVTEWFQQHFDLIVSTIIKIKIYTSPARTLWPTAGLACNALGGYHRIYLWVLNLMVKIWCTPCRMGTNGKSVTMHDSNYLVDLQATFQRYYVLVLIPPRGTGNELLRACNYGTSWHEYHHMYGHMSGQHTGTFSAMYAGLYLGPQDI
jgi:hypothetical protein